MKSGLMGGIGLNTLTKQMVESYGRYSARKEYLRSLDLIYDQQVDVNLGNHTNQNFTLEKQAKRREGLLEGRNPFVDSQEWKRFLDGAKVRYWEMVKKRK